MGEGINPFAMTSGPQFVRSDSGDIVATVPIRGKKSDVADRSLSAKISGDGTEMVIQTTEDGHLVAQRTSLRTKLPVKAVQVRAAAFDEAGNARIILEPAKDADISNLERASSKDLEAAAAVLADAKNVSIVGDGARKEMAPSTLALWQAALLGALAVLAALFALLWRLRRSKLAKAAVAAVTAQKSPLSQVLTQRVGESEDVVVFESRRKPVRKEKSDVKVS